MTRRKPGLGTGPLGQGKGSDVRRLLGQAHPGQRGAALREVPPGEVQRSPWQPRARIDSDELRTLVNSIREHGVLEPLLAREVGGSLELLAGERRLVAAKRAKLATVPVRVLPDVDDAAAQAIALTENMARADLSPWEESQGLAALRDALRAAGRSATIKELSRMTGRSTGAISESLQIAERVTLEVARRARSNVQSLNAMPREALLGIAKAGPEPADRAAVLRAAVQSDTPGKTARAATTRQRKVLPFTLVTRRGAVSLQLRKPAEKLKPEEARDLLKRLAPTLAALRERARE